MKFNAVRPDFALSLIFKGDSGIHPLFDTLYFRKIKQHYMQTLTYNKTTNQVILYNSVTANKAHIIQTFNNITTLTFGGERISGYNGQNSIVFSVPHAKTNVIYL